MKEKIVFLCLLCLFLSAFKAEDDTYTTGKRLFYIERSKNKNIVCYDFNVGKDGKLDKNTPVVVYWINREEYPGKRGELSYIQRKMAYGYTIAGKQEKSVTIELNALPDRQVIIEEDEPQLYSGKIMINKQLSILHKIYVKTRSSNSLTVEYVEISGVSVQTGLPISERITE
ncbi:MAG: DUF4833 domain-containing protein [Prevotellaceae bacterium]|jgi:hypothetical protein|nr:DUF4833 domain-containing protein [Prevotellaceae bacterium]